MSPLNFEFGMPTKLAFRRRVLCICTFTKKTTDVNSETNKFGRLRFKFKLHRDRLALTPNRCQVSYISIAGLFFVSSRTSSTRMVHIKFIIPSQLQLFRVFHAKTKQCNFQSHQSISKYYFADLSVTEAGVRNRWVETGNWRRILRYFLINLSQSRFAKKAKFYPSFTPRKSRD